MHSISPWDTIFTCYSFLVLINLLNEQQSKKSLGNIIINIINNNKTLSNSVFISSSYRRQEGTHSLSNSFHTSHHFITLDVINVLAMLYCQLATTDSLNQSCFQSLPIFFLFNKDLHEFPLFTSVSKAV